MHEQQEWLQVTLGSIGDAVIATDIEGRHVFLNAVAQELTGWTADEAAGKSLDRVFVIINEQSQQPVDSPIVRVLKEGRVVGLANHTVLDGEGRIAPADR